MWILFFIGVGTMVVLLVSVMAYVAMHQPEHEEQDIADVTQA